jgi:methionine aminopeptidase
LEHAAFQDLEELDASFCYASVESVRKMKRIAPNLKKLKIRHANSDTVNGLLEALENLEEVEIQISFSWEITD